MFFKVNFLLCFLLFLAQHGFAQLTAIGRVVDAKTGKPIENASVYFNETQIGTKTNAAGKFYINISQGNAKLVVSCVGYQKVVLHKIPQQNLKVVLKPIHNTLKEVIIGDRVGWKKWGRLFTRLLMSDIDEDYYSSKYKNDVVVNQKAVRFSFDQLTGILTAATYEPIWVMNDKLGYLVKIDLDEFKYDVNSEKLLYKSTLFFEPTKSTNSIDRLQFNTNHAYQGSATHFYKALVSGKLKEEGFSINTYTEVRNQEKERILDYINSLKNQALKQKQFALDLHVRDLIADQDTLAYYGEVFKQPDLVCRTLDTVCLDRILEHDKVNRVYKLKFKDSLMVTYRRNFQKMSAYVDTTKVRINKEMPTKMETLLYMMDDEPFELSEDGLELSYNLYMSGFMSKRRLATFMPADYEPAVPRKATAIDALKNHEALREKKR